MHVAASAILTGRKVPRVLTGRVGQLQTLSDDAEAGKCGIAMDEQAGHRGAAARAQPRLHCPYQPHDHRVHRLQMARIGCY